MRMWAGNFKRAEEQVSFHGLL